MSDTESFEYALWKAIDDCKIDENTDTITGSYTKSLSNQDRVVAAHIREIRDTAQQEYHRGFEAGRHSMDAEHRAVAMRLRQLPLDGDDTYENLLSIGQAIWHDDFGCTLDGGSKLRDELVRLMGGVSDDTCDSQCRGACAAGGCGCAGEQTEVGDGEGSVGDNTGDIPSSNRSRGASRDDNSSRGNRNVHRTQPKESEVEHGGTAHDSAADTRGGAGCDVVHLDGLSTYDVLWNERQKAVRALRRWKPEEAIDNDHCGEIQIRLLYQFLGLGGAMMMDGADAAINVRDRLIHLLGGDQPSGIDVLRAMDDGHSRTCPKSDEEMSKNAPSVSITDELREYVDTALKMHDDVPWYGINDENEADHNVCYVTEGKLLRIADRIDEQFDRICQQQEAVLQSIIDEVVEERKLDRLRIEKLEKQRDEARAKLDAIRDALDG